MTRIIGGSAGGRRISTPAGQHTRPTTDRVREALFSQRRGVVRLAPGAALPRPVRRLGRGRARGVVARRRGGHPGRVRPAHRPPDRRERQGARLRQGPRRDRAGRVRARPPAAGAVRRRLHATRPTRSTTRPWPDDLRLLRRAGLAGPRRAWSSSSGPSRSPEPAWPDGIDRDARAGSTARPRFGTVTPREPGDDAPCRVSWVLRPGHQRAPRHRPARRRASSTRSWSRWASTRPRTGSSRPRSASRCSSRASADLANVRVAGFTGLITTYCQRGRRRRRSSRDCARAPTSTTSCRWPR